MDSNNESYPARWICPFRGRNSGCSGSRAPSLRRSSTHDSGTGWSWAAPNRPAKWSCPRHRTHTFRACSRIRRGSPRCPPAGSCGIHTSVRCIYYNLSRSHCQYIKFHSGKAIHITKYPRAESPLGGTLCLYTDYNLTFSESSHEMTAQNLSKSLLSADPFGKDNKHFYEENKR